MVLQGHRNQQISLFFPWKTGILPPNKRRVRSRLRPQPLYRGLPGFVAWSHHSSGIQAKLARISGRYHVKVGARRFRRRKSARFSRLSLFGFVALSFGLLMPATPRPFRNKRAASDGGPIIDIRSVHWKPSASRCACQSSGIRVTRESLSAVRVAGWRPRRMAWVMSGASQDKRSSSAV